MKAVLLHKAGGPEELVYQEAPDPVAGPGQVVVRVQAAGINFSDTMSRRGVGQAAAASYPAILGSEAIGPIVAVGDGVTGFAVGEVVGSQGPRGCYAELAALPIDHLVKVPAGMDPRQGIPALLQARTAYAMSHGAYYVQPGDSVLVHAAAGGVGQLLVQMAKLLGGEVLATVGSDAKAEVARRAGADHVINYASQDFAAEVMRITGGAGVKAIYDAVGKATFQGDLACLGNRGVLVLYGAASGPIGAVDLGPLNRVGGYVTQTAARHFATTDAEYLRQANLMMEWVHTGRLKVGYTTYPLSATAQAHRDLEGRQTTGKLVLLP